MNKKIEPLINDEFAGEPAAKRLIAYLQSKREMGKKIAGIYCGYAPMELIRALDIVPAGLCSFSNNTIEAAEAVLPSNLCPLIKSSYGFILKDSCPFFGISDLVIGETTCDGKKKMFELISDRKPLFIMDLPQLPDEPEAIDNWTVMIGKLRTFLEKTINAETNNEAIETAIRESNIKARLMNRIFDYCALTPPVMGWQDLYDILFLAQVATGGEMEELLGNIVAKLAERKGSGYVYGKIGAPRVLVSGCPIAGDSAKVLSIIEEAGGVVVALEACSGMKGYLDEIEESTGDPMRAIAARYLRIPCSCMTPNDRRLEQLDRAIERFRPDAVVDVILHACHSYNVESYKVGASVQKRHRLPFLKIETDYSLSDVGQIRTRIDALLETCGN